MAENESDELSRRVIRLVIEVTGCKTSEVTRLVVVNGRSAPNKRNWKTVKMLRFNLTGAGTREVNKFYKIPCANYRGHNKIQRGRYRMPKVDFKKEEKDVIISKVQRYFKEELDQEIGQFDAGFLLNFFAEKIGPFFYNRGLSDAQRVIEERFEYIKDALYEIEMPTK